MHIYKLANEREDAFMDHSGTLIDSRTGAPLLRVVEDDEDDDGPGDGAVTPGGENFGVYTDGYSFYDSVSISL